jgi:putative hydrolase of HD superfamily
MHPFPSPEEVVRRQLEAYNAKDLEGLMQTYDENARLYELGGELLARGHPEIRARTAQRFEEPNLHARLLRRVVMGEVVVDHEEVDRTFPDGPGRMELVCVYRVVGGRILSATFHPGPRRSIPAA